MLKSRGLLKIVCGEQTMQGCDLRLNLVYERPVPLRERVPGGLYRLLRLASWRDGPVESHGIADWERHHSCPPTAGRPSPRAARGRCQGAACREGHPRVIRLGNPYMVWRPRGGDLRPGPVSRPKLLVSRRVKLETRRPGLQTRPGPKTNEAVLRPGLVSGPTKPS